jgi:hypothetical protein
MNYIPFVGLVLATPGLGISRRLRGLAVGVIVIFVSHLLFNLTATRENGFQLNEATAVLSDALPIVLWALIARDTLVRLGVRAFGMTPVAFETSGPAEQSQAPARASEAEASEPIEPVGSAQADGRARERGAEEEG